MSRNHARHRKASPSSGVVRRTLATAGFGVLASAAIAGTSTAAWACPSGSHSHTRASVHHAVAHGHAAAHGGGSVAMNDRSSTTGSMRGASPSNPDGMTNGGADKPWRAALANDDVDGNNGTGNDLDCEDDNNGVGTPGHCGVNANVGDEAGFQAHEMRGASPSNPDGMTNGGLDKSFGAAVANDDVDGNNGSGNDLDCEDDNNGVGTPGHCGLDMHAGAGADGSVAGMGASLGANAVTAVLGEHLSRGLATGGTGSGSAASASTSVGATVSAAAGTGATAVSPSSTALPFTGSGDLPVVGLVGAAGVLTGVGLIRAGRRRRDSTARQSVA